MAADPVPARYSVVIADDHPVVRLGVRALLAAAPEFQIAAEASDGEEAVREVRRQVPDLLLLDLSMPALPGLETLRHLADASARLKTILLTGRIDPQQVLEALQLGARGIVLKGEVAEHLVLALRSVVAGRYWLRGSEVPNLVEAVRSLLAEQQQAPNRFRLTARELDIVRAIAEGGSNRDIATRFSITEDTVKRHLTNVFNKTGVSTRLELALFAVHHGLVIPD